MSESSNGQPDTTGLHPVMASIVNGFMGAKPVTPSDFARAGLKADGVPVGSIRVADVMARVHMIDTPNGRRCCITRGNEWYNIARANFTPDRLAASQFSEPDDADAVCARVNARDMGGRPGPTLADRRAAADKAIDDKGLDRLLADLKPGMDRLADILAHHRGPVGRAERAFRDAMAEALHDYTDAITN